MSSEKKFPRKRWFILVAVLLFLHFYQLPYFYTEPGDSRILAAYVEVEDGYEDQGSFMLTTVKMGKANTFFYVWSQFSDFRLLIPEDHMIGPDETDDDYFHRQRMMMTSSQEAAKIIAYKKAGKTVMFDHRGVLVMSFIDGMPAAKILQPEDRIIAVEGVPITTVTELNQRVGHKEAGEEVMLTVDRDGEELQLSVPIAQFPDELGGEDGRAGLGIMYPVADRDVTYEPNVSIDTEKIGGPSAGLMFSLEVYNRLVEEDITKGYQIAGTGTIDEDGYVGRIGGVKQKVVAAHNASVDIFFAPKEEGREDSNYVDALKAAEQIGTSMKIVGVNTFDEALAYLEKQL
ncbi:SepM family pheromone-processing serine protease [Bacillus sp. FJAT-45350]|uniref:SepM family pheromone-processing serine protease n=1 Tax=Bacillus sp. FJAT-45350 TaxID=2011014 RepID=UPI000BB8941A|nr:SepM family pheromone-processing serine protease [Bacillus sp. FJAT-45350]